MSHMVIYRSVDGKPGFQQTDDLVSAVEYVERLRNVEGVENARIYRLEQVNFRFQPYFQVHLESADAPPAPPLTVTSPPAHAAAHAAAAAPAAAAPAASVESAPMPPPATIVAPEEPAVPATAAAEPAPVDAGAPTLGATPAPEPGDGNGIRRGLFGR